MCYFSGLFWGIIVIVLGAAILIKHIFNLDFPVIKVVFGAALILIGLRILVFKGERTPCSAGDKNNVVFGERTMHYNASNNEYNAIFSSAVLDLTKLEASTDARIKVSCVFGNMKIIINKQTKLNIDSDVVFGSISNPEESTLSDSNQIMLKMKADAVFGNIKIIRE
jgi:predicted membrane protein